MDSEIDAALTVLFLSLRQTGKGTRQQRPGIALVVTRLAIQLVGRERERDAVGAIEVAQRLEERAAEDRMTRRVGGERRREVWALQVARRSAERR